MELKKDRILEIADIIEQNEPEVTDVGFDMDLWVAKNSPDHNNHTCGTTMCIAGWSLARYGTSGRATKMDLRRVHAFDGNWYDVGASILGLSFNDADELFNPLEAHVDPVWAAETLRHLAETGEVDWHEGSLRAEKRS